MAVGLHCARNRRCLERRELQAGRKDGFPDEFDEGGGLKTLKG